MLAPRRLLSAALCCAIAAACGPGSTTTEPPAQPAVEVQPATAQVLARATLGFAATVAGTPAAVTWSVQEGASGGTITSGGVYTAPGTVGQFHVVATSASAPDVFGTATVTVTAAPVADLASQLVVLSGKAVYFGHRSVGGNIMDGVRSLLTANTGAEPRVVTTSSAASMGAGIWAEALNGQNFDPIGKINAFETTLGSGVGGVVNIAFFKFCWVDFNDESAHFAGGGTPESLFVAYRAKMTALKAAYPAITFVHVTAPLTTDAYGDGRWNPRREAYSNLVRSTYGGKEPVLDVARLESTDPSGNPVNGIHGPALYPGYTDDGGHLNATGQDKVARELVKLLAGL